jgi:hydroxymethylglutaryl-CoA synthase
MGVGLLSYGAYIPRLRLQRDAVAGFNAWFTGSAHAKGERAMANWDEDSITMAVEAARDCLAGFSTAPGAVHFVSTSPAFDDRQNAGVVASALDLDDETETLDLVSSQRAGTSGLIQALRAAAGGGGPVLVAAGEHRRTRSASLQERAYGDGAAAMLVGTGQTIANLVGAHTVTADLVDHYRGRGATYDYTWEERWVREEGWLKLVPAAIAGALEKAGLAASDIRFACIPGTLAKIQSQVAKAAGLREDAPRDNLAAVCGDTGSAHALLMLAHALEDAAPGDRILVIGFGQGCDALIFEVTPAIRDLPPRTGVSGALARRKPEHDVGKFLAFNDGLDLERGMRAELDKQTALSALYRNRRMIQGLVGGVCRTCGTRQFPKSNICVNPNCREWNSQDPHRFADAAGRVMSFTADMLTYSPDPPSHCGMIEFDGGGRFMADFTDVELGQVAVGMPMKMMFRIKDIDPQRNFVRYFWKAAPAAVEAI